jgi:hypothetical protein
MAPWIIPASSDDYIVSLHRRLGLELAAGRAALLERTIYLERKWSAHGRHGMPRKSGMGVAISPLNRI